MKQSQKGMNFVTFLTFVRVPLVFFFCAGAVVHASRPSVWLFCANLAFLALGALSDLVDGYLARKLQVVSKLGALADPLTDKVFYLVSLPTLVYLAAHNGRVAHARLLLVLTVLFLIRDQWVSFMRSIGSQYGADVKANWSGKLRTAFSFPVVCLVYAYEAQFHPWFPCWIVYALEAAAVGINLLSIGIYTRGYWPYLKRSFAKVAPGPAP
jgi:CDP-diacylglycerol--glycerol-3-phosphate 3-phosphatidyltransferase